MNFSDSELMMIEQLSYLDINQRDENTDLGTLLDEKYKDIDSMNSEDAAVIRYMKENEKFRSLVLADTMQDEYGNTIALCFTDGSTDSEAIVAFQGTLATDQDGGAEWGDNVEGFNSTDTEKQKEALDFVESQPYENITVTGHSKGGNKSMYVSIKSDKVTRCVSMDGQGFSPEFIDKYGAEIEENSHKITNYSIDNDPVNVLMFPIPGSNQKYCIGRKGGSVEDIHHQSNFFIIEDGHIKVNEKGEPIIRTTTDDGTEVECSDTSRLIHEFTVFVLNVANDDDKEKIVNFIASVLSTDDKMNCIINNQEVLPLILAYLVKYLETYNLSASDIEGLLIALGFGQFNEMIGPIDNALVKKTVLGDLLDENNYLKDEYILILLDLILKNISDGSSDIIIHDLLKILTYWLKFLGKDIDINKIWEETESKIEEIGYVDPEDGRREPEIQKGQVRDFSVAKYNAIINAIDKIQSGSFDGLSAWDTYADEDWYASLLIGPLKRAINSYYDSLYQTNSTCKERVEKVFSDVENIDSIAKIKNFANIAQRNLVVSNLHRHATSIG